MTLKILSSFSFIFPCLLGFIFYSVLSRDLRATFISVLLSGLVDSITYFQYTSGYNNSLVLNLYIPIYFFIWFVPVYLATSTKGLRKILSAICIATIAFLVYQLANIDLRDIFYSNGISIVGTVLIIINLIFLFYVALLSDKSQLRDHPLFFISSAFIVYQAFNTSIFVFMNILDGEALTFLWDFRYMSNIVLNIVISVVFIFYARIRK